MGIFDTIPNDGPMSRGQEQATSNLFESYFKNRAAASETVKGKTKSIVSSKCPDCEGVITGKGLGRCSCSD